MKKVTIVGVGALGSHVMLLARNWKVNFHLVDFDKVEQKNTQAQFHSRMGLRQNKALAMAKSLLGQWGLKVQTTPHKVTSDNVEVILGGSDLVIDCTDNIKARELIQAFVKANDIPCLHGALSAAGDFGCAIWTEEFVPDSEGAEGEATCEDGENLPFFVQASSVVTNAAQTFLKTGKKHSFQFGPAYLMRL
jgi:predicted ThiF/HesA family dinucleotide-utilizing enzyme